MDPLSPDDHGLAPPPLAFANFLKLEMEMGCDAPSENQIKKLAKSKGGGAAKVHGPILVYSSPESPGHKLSENIRKIAKDEKIQIFLIITTGQTNIEEKLLSVRR